jgi:hypothetical protein
LQLSATLFLQRVLNMKRKNSPPMTPELADQIKQLVLIQGLFQHQAAAIVGVNQGRVSEVINGKWPPRRPGQPNFDF